jgi:hypothetical protein
MQSETPYLIKFENLDKYLFVHVTGEKDSLDVSLQFWQEIFKECEARNYKKVLVTENFKNNISAIDMYILGERLVEMAAKDTCVAFVDNQIKQLEMNKFTETVIYNRGGKGRIFSDMHEAETWLLQQ